MEGMIEGAAIRSSRPTSGFFAQVAKASTTSALPVESTDPTPAGLAASARFHHTVERECLPRSLTGGLGPGNLRLMSPSANLVETWPGAASASSRGQPSVWGSRPTDFVQEVTRDVIGRPNTDSNPGGQAGAFRQAVTRVMPSKSTPAEQARNVRNLSIVGNAGIGGIGNSGQNSQAGPLVPQGDLVRSRVVSGGGLYLLEDRPPQSGFALRRGRLRQMQTQSLVPLTESNRGYENGQDMPQRLLSSPPSPVSPGGLSVALRNSVSSWQTRSRRVAAQTSPLSENVTRLHGDWCQSVSSSFYSSAATSPREAQHGNEMQLTGANIQRQIGPGRISLGGAATAVVSAQQLRKEVRKGSKPGDVDSAVDLVEALKQACIERFGDLDKAFRWFDWNNRLRVSRFMWETGMRMLNIDRGLKSKSAWFFNLLDKGQNGEFSFEEWQELFCYNKEVATEAGSELQDTSEGVIRERLLSRVRKLKDFVSKNCGRGGRSSLSPTASGNAAGKARSGAAAEQETIIEAASEAPMFIDDSNAPTGAMPNLNSLLRLSGDEDGLADDGGLSPALVAKAKAALLSTDVHRAEEATIMQDIERLDLRGIRALAYILTAKCGSLDLAFQWLDSGVRGHFTRVHWDTAVICLHLDVEKLTGMHPTRVFLKMSQNGCVTKEAWDRFFTENSDPSDKELLGGLRKGFKSRMGKELQKLWNADDVARKKTSESNQSKAARQSFNGAPSRSPPAEKKERKPTNGGRGKQIRPPSPARSYQSEGSTTNRKNSKVLTAPKTGPHVSSANGKERNPESRKSSKSFCSTSDNGNAECSTVDTIDREESCDKEPFTEAERLRLAREAAEQRRRAAEREAREAREAAEREATQSRLRREREEAEATPNRLRREREEAEKAALTQTLSPEQEFEESIRNDLHKLTPDETKQYKNMKRPDRVVLQQVANDMGLWSHNEGQEVSVYREGPNGRAIREGLEALRPGEVKVFEELPLALWRYARGIAEGLDLFIASGEEHGNGDMTVYNLNGSNEEFAAGLNDTLIRLKPGQVIEVQNAAISPERQLIMHKLAAEYGYFSHTFEDAAGVTSIGHLSKFRESLRKEIAGLKPGELSKFGSKSKCSRHVKGKKLPVLARHLVHAEAVDAGCVASNVPDRVDDEVVQVLRLGSSEDENIGIDEDAELEEEELQEQVSQVFDMIATGQGGKVLLRNTDLIIFAERTARLRGKKLEENIIEALEGIYDDTLELQIDMGSRHTRGITRDYLQVFLVKTANVLGWSLSALLMAFVKAVDD